MRQTFREHYAVKEVPFATMQRNREVFFKNRWDANRPLAADEIRERHKFAAKDNKIIEAYNKQTNDRTPQSKNSATLWIATPTRHTSAQSDEFEKRVKRRTSILATETTYNSTAKARSKLATDATTDNTTAHGLRTHRLGIIMSRAFISRTNERPRLYRR